MSGSEISGAAIFNLVAFCGLFFFAGFAFGSTYKRKKIYRYPSTGWLKVSEHSIPEDIDLLLLTKKKFLQKEE